MENRTIHRSEGDRLQPALLDRLSDDEPEKRQETLEHSVVSKVRLKRTVLRDLSWLLNTTCHDTHGELLNHREARRSVINFGIPVLSGKNFSGVDWRELERSIHVRFWCLNREYCPTRCRSRRYFRLIPWDTTICCNLSYAASYGPCPFRLNC